MERRLTAILAADIVGYTRLMERDEAGTLARVNALEAEVLRPLITQHSGRLVKTMGDGFLVEFASVVDALTCALAWQSAVETRASQVSPDLALRLRIGVSVGDIIVSGTDIHGEYVNLAARLEGLAEPGTILTTAMAQDQAKGKIAATFEDLGLHRLKNISEPHQLYRVSAQEQTIGTKAFPKTKPTSKIAFLLALLAIMAAAGGTTIWLRPWETRQEPADLANLAYPLPDRPSVAVLPFDNMSEDPNQAYFADGMTEDLITDLSKISGLFVIARNSSFSYKGQQVKVRQVAEELGVRYVIEGSVRKVGNQVRINAQLIDAKTDGHIWAERYDGTLDNIFDLQDQVTAQIVQSLKVNLTGEEEVAQTRHETENVAAHDAYLQGWALYELGTLEDYKRALVFLNEAIELDPNYTQARAALAALYLDVLERDWAFDLDMPSARAEEFAQTHIDKAMENPTPLAFIASSRLMAHYGLADFALSEAEKAIALDGNDVVALAGLADALIRVDRPTEALGHIERALRRDPHHPPNYLTIHGGALFGVERFDEALVVFERAIERSPESEVNRIYRAAILAFQGRVEEADDAIEATNEVRNRMGVGELSLRPTSKYGFIDFDAEIDFPSYGGTKAQELLRSGLAKIPALSWQYLVNVNRVLGPTGTTFDVEGAPLLSLREAKVLYDRGAIFIDTSLDEIWLEARVKGAHYLPADRGNSLTDKRLDRRSIRAIADLEDEVVLYYSDRSVVFAGWEAAKALIWGYRKVYHFAGGAKAWKEAGYPVESGPND